jgi:hypothetical protein
MATWYQSNFTGEDGRCSVLEGDDFKNKVVAWTASPEIAALIVQEHEFAEQHRAIALGRTNAEGT